MSNLLGFGQRKPTIGATADYNRSHYMFNRTQSRAMQELEWEDRAKPIRSWGANLLANLAWDLLH